MKHLHVTFEGTPDSTGFLFSLAKCLSASLRNSAYADYADDIVATSGFAFRMWINRATLCPSATSIWEFKKQKSWVENGGLSCRYVERLWGQDAVEEERRLKAIELIKDAIDQGIAPVAWDISGCEWGIITGYDDDTQTLETLKINNKPDAVPYDRLGKLDLPILSVLAVTGKSEKSPADLVADTKRLAVAHLTGKEWCDNAKGLAAYDALISFIETALTPDHAWNLKYNLGTYAALKQYAALFFEKYSEPALANLYREIHDSWNAAFKVARKQDLADPQTKAQLITLLTSAQAAEQRAVEIMTRI